MNIEIRRGCWSRRWMADRCWGIDVPGIMVSYLQRKWAYKKYVIRVICRQKIVKAQIQFLERQLIPIGKHLLGIKFDEHWNGDWWRLKIVIQHWVIDLWFVVLALQIDLVVVLIGDQLVLIYSPLWRRYQWLRINTSIEPWLIYLRYVVLTLEWCSWWC